MAFILFIDTYHSYLKKYLFNRGSIYTRGILSFMRFFSHIDGEKGLLKTSVYRDTTPII